MINPICFALDGMSEEMARLAIQPMEPHVGAFKVGLELFIRGRGYMPKTKNPVILDLKLHDIPETVENAVKAGIDLGAKFMTLHIQQKKALERAAKVADDADICLLGVTVLTSMTVSDFRDLKYDWDEERQLHGIGDVAYRVRELVRFGRDCGLRGFVCSPEEVKMVREVVPNAFLLVPGIRPAGAEKNDQKRTGTPRQAVLDGASMIVVGRPIRDAAHPVEAAKRILAETRDPVPSDTGEG